MPDLADEQAACGDHCREVLADASQRSLTRSFAARGEAMVGRMLASADWPTTLASSTFPPLDARCPHGTVWWAYPDANLIEALTALNEGRSLPDDREGDART